MVTGPRQSTPYPRCAIMLTLEGWLPKENLRGVPARTPVRVPSGTLWPHDEFSLGYAAHRPDGGEWHEDPYVNLGVDDVAMAERASRGDSPLNLSDASNSHKTAKRGLKGITGYGRNMVKAVGALMNRQYPQHRVTFCTVTLPEMEESERRWVAMNWGELTRGLIQWVSRQLETAGAPRVVCSVSEIQPKRLQETGQGCLHWHLIWLNVPAKKGAWSINPVKFRAWLHRVISRKLNTNSLGHVNVNVKPVKGEVARYMAKYMSKGSETLAEAQEDWGEGVTPSTWWNMNKVCRDWVRANTHKGREAGEIIETMLDYGWETSDLSFLEFIRQVELDVDGSLITVGWRGRFERRCADNIRTMIESDDIVRLLA